MRKFLIPVAIIGLMAGTSFAMAQDHDRGGPRGGEQRGGEQHGGAQAGGPQRGNEQRGNEQRGGPAMSGPREHRDAPAMRATPNPPANTMRSNDNDRRDNRAMRGPDNNNAMRGPGNGARPDFNRPGSNRPNNAMRGPHRDFSNFRNYHQNFRAERRFHAPVYRRPPGWYARRWTWGEFLPVTFWSRNYWITDFNVYDLPPPPFGAIWVRVGGDALLIDQDSGEIIEVDYGIFY